MKLNTADKRTCIPASKIENDCYDWWKRHELKCREAIESQAEVIFFGDSITHFWSNEDNINYGEGLWDELFAGKAVRNLGFGFDRTQNVLWRIENGELQNQNPKLFILNIGTNQFSITEKYDGDSPEDTADGICCVVNRLHTLFPQAHIAVMALFPRGGKQPLINATDELLKQRIPSMPNSELIDLRAKLINAAGEPDPQFYQSELTHLCRRGYEVWAEAIMPLIHKHLATK